MKINTKSTWFLVLFCVCAILLLPVTVCIAVIMACGGDLVFLRALRGHPEKPEVDNRQPHV